MPLWLIVLGVWMFLVCWIIFVIWLIKWVNRKHKGFGGITEEEYPELFENRIPQYTLQIKRDILVDLSEAEIKQLLINHGFRLDLSMTSWDDPVTDSRYYRQIPDEEKELHNGN